MMWHRLINKLNTYDKLMLLLTENMDRNATNSNGIELHEINPNSKT